MLHASTKRLIDKLGEMTLKNRVAWTEGENGQIVHETEGYRVTVSPPPCAVILSTTDGKEIEICAPEELAEEAASQNQSYAAFVADLYTEASRYARGAEQAIATLLKGLETADAPETAELQAAAEDEMAEAGEDGSTLEDPADESGPLPAGMADSEDTETNIQKAVATLAEQVNTPAAAPAEVYTPAFIDSDDTGTVYADALPVADPAPQVSAQPSPPVETQEAGPSEDADSSPLAVAEAPLDEPETEAPQEDPPRNEVSSPPPLSGPISLSGISAGFGLGKPGEIISGPSTGALTEPGGTNFVPPAEKIVIDGTSDLPDWPGGPIPDTTLDEAPAPEERSPHAPNFESAETIGIVGTVEPTGAAGKEAPTAEPASPSDSGEEASSPAPRYNPWN